MIGRFLGEGRRAAPRPDQRPDESNYIPTLDGWRAIAISIVMAQHGADQLTAFFGSWIEPVTGVFKENGRFGVYIFFAISGYLICSRLLHEEATRGRVDLRSFYIRRVFRILPPLVVFLIALGVLGLLGVVEVPLGKWLSSLLFFNNYYPGGSWYLGHFWSLAIEEHFYLIWPVLLFALGRTRSLRAGLLLIVAVAVWRFIDLSTGLTAGAPLRFDDRTDVQFDGLMWGCVFAILCLDPERRRRLAGVVAGWRYWIIAAMLLVTQAVNLSSPLPESLQLAVRPLLVGLLVVGTVLHPATPLAGALERRPLRWLGRISYSLYLWQQLFLVWAVFAAPDLEVVQTFPVSVLCALACAVLSFRFVERPMMRVGRRLAAAGDRPHTVAANLPARGASRIGG